MPSLPEANNQQASNHTVSGVRRRSSCSFGCGDDRAAPQGIAFLLAIDFVVDMARTAVNVTGNSLASMVIAKSEGQFTPQQR